MAQLELTGEIQVNLPKVNSLPLREHRMRSRVSLEEIAERTKIGKRFLQAIEEGDYEYLPGGVFRTSYIRQYAEATGYDADVILEHCRELSGEGAGNEDQPVVRERAGIRLMRFLQLG